MPNIVNKNNLDVAHIFQTYIAFNGDVPRCSLALDLPQPVIRALATDERWDDKLKDWSQLAEGDLRDAQVQINRAVNYVQASRMRSIVDGLISEFLKKTPAELMLLFTKATKDGSEFLTRPLTDLVKAAEACQIMTQRALGDKNSDDKDTPTSGSKMSLLVQRAMAAADQVDLDSVGVVKKSLQLPPDAPPNVLPH
jgi:hypothetical protein